MPYKDPEKQRAAARTSYERRREVIQERQRARRATEEGKALRLRERARRGAPVLARMPGCYLCGDPSAPDQHDRALPLCACTRCAVINAWWFGQRWRRRRWRIDASLYGLYVVTCYLEAKANEKRESLRT
jgi:hypothetical protein